MAKYRLKKFVVIALMIALEFVLSRFLSISTQFVKIGFGFVPILFVAYLYGPVWAGLAWALSDFLGAMLFPIGPYFPGFTLTALLSGLIFGLFLFGRPQNFWRCFAAAFLVTMGLNLFLDTYWLIALYGEGYQIFIGWRLVKCAITLALQLVFMDLIGNRLFFLVEQNGEAGFQKKNLRTEARAFFSGEFQSRRAEISAAVAENVAVLPGYKDARTLFCYVGTETELNTSLFIARALAEGKRVCVPLCEQNYAMTAREISSLGELLPGQYGLLEPSAAARVVSKDEIDLAVVPALVCDRRGYRIGRGGGYYDRYLKKTKFLKIAVCPDEMVRRRVLAGLKDIKADCVVTETRRYRFE